MREDTSNGIVSNYCYRTGADRKEKEKKCATKPVTGIQKLKDLESTLF